jgi:hypothetical protein
MKGSEPSRVVFALILPCLVSFATVGWGQSPRSVQGRNLSRFPCLQKTIKLDDVVTYGNSGNVTIKNKLIEIKARCRGNTLVDGKGRQVYFYPLQGCWGNPPADYQEILDRQAREIAKLRRKYRVIEMACGSKSPLLGADF